MKKHIIYECEICTFSSPDKATVADCEAHGLLKDDELPPRGTLIGTRCGPGPECAGKCGSHLCRAGFIYAVENAFRVREAHYYEIGVTIFRGNGNGDDPPEFKPTSGRTDTGHLIGVHVFHDGTANVNRMKDWPEARECAALLRAENACLIMGVTPYVLRAGIPLPTDEARKRGLL